MKCEQCNGEGCKHCQGGGDREGEDGKGDKEGNKPGKGKTGKGRGQGERPEEETDKKFYDSKVSDKARKGQSVRIGEAEGKNARGNVTVEELRSQINEGLKSREPDASDDTALSREQKKHTKEYFEKFRKGDLP